MECSSNCQSAFRHLPFIFPDHLTIMFIGHCLKQKMKDVRKERLTFHFYLLRDSVCNFSSSPHGDTHPQSKDRTQQQKDFSSKSTLQFQYEGKSKCYEWNKSQLQFFCTQLQSFSSSFSTELTTLITIPLFNYNLPTAMTIYLNYLSNYMYYIYARDHIQCSGISMLSWLPC